MGLLLYYAYTYVMYAFWPFPDVFLAYVAIRGMSSYGLLDGLLRLDVAAVAESLAAAPRRATGWSLLVVAGLFAAMWMAMILPAIPGGLPEGRMTYDIASAVHILDLAFVLPLMATTGVMLLSSHPAGPALASVLLVLKLTLGLSLLAMSFAFAETPAWGEAGLWAAIVLVSGGWIAAGLRLMRPVKGPWIAGAGGQPTGTPCRADDELAGHDKPRCAAAVGQGFDQPYVHQGGSRMKIGRWPSSMTSRIDPGRPPKSQPRDRAATGPCPAPPAADLALPIGLSRQLWVGDASFGLTSQPPPARPAVCSNGSRPTVYRKLLTEAHALEAVRGGQTGTELASA